MLFIPISNTNLCQPFDHVKILEEGPKMSIQFMKTWNSNDLPGIQFLE